MSSTTATYVYCVLAAARRPRLSRTRRGLPGSGLLRLLDVESGLFAVVADAPLARYGEEAIQRGLSDLDWVSKAAVAHEAVVESFSSARAVLPMKLFTMFTSDARAIEHVRAARQRIAALVKRVANHEEWGVRVVLDRARAVAKIPKPKAGTRSGVGYLARKKQQRDASVELAERAHSTIADVYDRFAARSRLAKRRSASELPAQGGPLLLDAAFLVPRSRAASFRAFVSREACALARNGYGLTVSGPWPPYTFVQD